jgi:hypothetical protein
MTFMKRLVAALFAVTLIGAASPTPAPTPTRKPQQTFDNALKCLGDASASEQLKLNCIMDIEYWVHKNGIDAATKAYIPLATTCFKDSDFLVRFAASRTIPRLRINRNGVVADELKLFLDPDVIASTNCLHEADNMTAHLSKWVENHSFASMQANGMVDLVWNALLNGTPFVQKNALGEFYTMLSKGSPKELLPYKDRAEKYFDYLFSADAAKLGEENFITISIDQVAAILFAMNDYVFIGNHLLLPIASYVLYPNDKQPKAVSPDRRWGYADDLNYGLRDRMRVKLKFDDVSAKVWANAIQALIVAATPVKNQRQCIDRSNAVENLVFAGHDVQQISLSTLSELASEPSHAADFGESNGCGEVEARAMGSGGKLQQRASGGEPNNTIISTGTDLDQVINK